MASDVSSSHAEKELYLQKDRELNLAAEAVLVFEYLENNPSQEEMGQDELFDLFYLKAPFPLPKKLALEAEILVGLNEEEFLSRYTFVMTLKKLGGLDSLRMLADTKDLLPAE